MDSLRIWKVKNISPVSEEVIWKYDSFGYDFVVTADRLIFLLHTDDFYLRDEADVQYFTSYAQYAANAVDAYLVKSGAKQWINEECFAVTKKTYYEGNDISHTVGESIYINRYLFQWAHEYVHTIIFNKSGYLFYQEGIAEYIGKIIVNEPYYYDFYLDSFKYYSESKEIVQQKVIEEYEKLASSPVCKEDFDIRSFYIACTKVSLDEPIGGPMETFIDEPLYSRYVIPEKDRKIGDELSYIQAAVFVEYLSVTYGFDMVVKSYIQNEPIEESYGKSYEQLKEDWIEWLYEQVWVKIWFIILLSGHIRE